MPEPAIKTLRKADPVLAGVIDAVGPLDREARRRGRPTDPYGALIRTIVGQQLSTKAARTIYLRLTALFGEKTPTPSQLLAADPDQLRAAGLSRPKVSYLRDLAERVVSGDLDLDGLTNAPDDEVISQLVAVKGLGQWSADMFLMFHLGRPDVMPVGDLGIRNAIRGLYELTEPPDPARMLEISEPWRPHRTLACLYLWESLDTAPA